MESTKTGDFGDWRFLPLACNWGNGGGRTMATITYFKRFRMEIDLGSFSNAPQVLPDDYALVAWDPVLVDRHAEAKFRSFQGELDANVFPSLGARDGCRRLMREIARKKGFVPEATWLLIHRTVGRRAEYCGTVQGMRDSEGYGAIQNLGIVPEHRGRGLGSCLLTASLEGFRQSGLQRACLEVTSHNSGAIRLYERFGFRRMRTVYKASEVAG